MEFISEVEQGYLVATAQTEGFKVVHKMLRNICETYTTHLLNQNEADDKAIIAAHKMAKVAAQIYTTLAGQIQEVLTQYRYAPNPMEKPKDYTEGILDLDSIAEITNDIPNFFNDNEE